MSQQNEVIDNLEALRNAARALRWALLQADAEAIYDAVQSQTPPLSWLRANVELTQTAQDQAKVKELSLQIVDLNQQNRVLSQNGLCAVRTFFSPATEQAGYDASGSINADWQPVETLGATA